MIPPVNVSGHLTSAAVGQTDIDPAETREWLEAFDAVVSREGQQRAQYLFDRLADHALGRGVQSARARVTPYCNTIPLARQPHYPGDEALEAKLAAAIRWNALVMVMRANRDGLEQGGHIASYASAADLFEVGFQHFFKGSAQAGGGDLVFFQPHSAPGVYARAFLEGHLSEQQLDHYRREIGGHGLSSYPHPWLMPDFWQFPTGSMGLGPINAIYQARFLRYLHHRGLSESSQRRVWGFFGDGEMDEPESIGALSLAAREGLDHLSFVINCNLQRLDGPVRGNGRIVDELEALFTGAGWHVIKVLWSSDWDFLFARDTTGELLRAFANTVDGQFQTLSANDGAYNRERFFAQSPELAALVADLSDADIDRLRRGGHDVRKLHAAYAAAVAHRGQPTVILAKTMKGFGMGSIGQGRMTTHQQKKLDTDQLRDFRDRFGLPLPDAGLDELPFYRPAEDSAELRYLRARREALGGYLPRRRMQASAAVAVPPAPVWAGFALNADSKEMSTTMAVVRMLGNLLKDAELGPRIVPIVADEARTFGMASLFRQVGIYSPHGQLYEPEDLGSMLYYREETSGQILEEGISEAGAISSWIAAATSYSVSDTPMLPFYIYYSMFGYQRVGDLVWAAADQRARGFLLGATSGRTTLNGEGLQHQDGSSLVMFATVPNCRSFDPTFAYEIAVLLEHGMRAMLEQQRDEFYYLTVGNANLAQPSLPAGIDSADIVRGLYRLPGATSAGVQLLGSGAIMAEVLRAQVLLREDFGIEAAVWSATSYSELQREGIECERLTRLGRPTEAPWVERAFADSRGPIIAASDYVRAWPELIRAFVPRRYLTLGTDGFGRSDTRAGLRAFFEVDAESIVIAALHALAQEGALADTQVVVARERYRRTHCDASPWRL
ncbi:alpha-ketoglutarate dehydrogenase [Aquimonas sp.]|jgi:pyruvate dehydrogenase E1 component|uniref:alpha-ketoglutarate dehydrogenase n=1 Tax=Aquimonas sp. TaxID=1872588 RepID=UPI0037BF2CAD